MTKLRNLDDVAEILAVSRSTVLRMIMDGALPAVCLRSGRRKKVWRVREEVLQNWIVARERQGMKGRTAAPHVRDPVREPINANTKEN